MPRKKALRVKITGDDRSFIQWFLDELEDHFDCIVGPIKNSSQGGHHAFVTVVRDE